MADSISFKVFDAPVKAMLADKDRRMPRAAMWTVREAGRVVRRRAKQAAPVLKDKNYESVAQVRRRKKQGQNVTGAYDRPVRGLLRDSIKPSRAIRIDPAGYRLTVAPRGERVHLYAGKMENLYHYMEAGERSGEVALVVAAQQAFGRVWTR